ncbi:MAG: hypothetical protein NVS4B12_08690 [Ktedonobacteraceae bacterium]
MQKSLVALDTDSWKSYVFRTDTLQEICGASLILDRLNRVTMLEIAYDPSIAAWPIYTNGGSGLFLVDEDKADAFGAKIQKAFLATSGGSLSITYAVQLLSPTLPEDIEELMQHDLGRELELLRCKLREGKGRPRAVITLPSHPFFRLCDACGIEYAEQLKPEQANQNTALFYCNSCKEKCDEDERVGKRIEETIKALRDEEEGEWSQAPSDSTRIVQGSEAFSQKSLWDRVLMLLKRVGYGYVFDNDRPVPKRVENFNTFRTFAYRQEYVGLIYADANNIGAKIEALTTLAEIRDFANEVDQAIHLATCLAIKKHLPIYSFAEGREDTVALFPFEILLLGGDDVMMVTDGTRAMDVALLIAQEFRRITENKHSLAISVILAPVKYPFSLLVGLLDGTHTFAKRRSAEIRVVSPDADDSCINFMTVKGGNLNDFEVAYNRMYRKIDKNTEFYATLRPYTSDQLEHLLSTIREGNRLNLGRSRLYQLREAIFNMNLTQSVADSLAILRNWQEAQRKLIVSHVYQFGGLYQMPYNDARDPIKGFPRVTFPWFVDNTFNKTNEKERVVYRTSLLDFVELYDFVSR